MQLTNRASLGAISNGLRVATHVVVGFVVTPVIALGLGRELYGAWAMIQQIVGHLAVADLRASSTVKFHLASRCHDPDVNHKRQLIGAFLIVLRRVAGLILLIGVVVVWLAPKIISVPDGYATTVRLAVMISIFGLFVGELSSLPGNVLRGLNLEYKAMGLQAGVAAFASLLGGAAVLLGLGLPGLALAGVVGDLVMGAGRWLVVRHNVPWFGASNPSAAVLVAFWRNSLWISVATVGALLQTGSDLILAGIVLGPAAAAMLATTGTLLRIGIGSVFSLIGAANPGLASLCGQGAWDRVSQVRNELHVLSLIAVVSLGVPVLIFNGSLVSHWISPSFYAGDAVNQLLVALSVITIPLKLDTMLIDSMLEFKARAIIVSICSAFGLGFGALLAESYGMPGIVMGVASGSALCAVCYAWIVSRRLSISNYTRWMRRPAAVGLILLTVAACLPRLEVGGLIETLLCMGVVGLAAFGAMWGGMSSSHRVALLARVAIARGGLAV